MRRVLVTGITGFLGGHVARGLLAEGYGVIGIKRSTSSLDSLADIAERVRWIDIDNTVKADAVQDAWPRNASGRLESIDAVLHLATAYGRGDEGDAAVLEANVVFPLRLLERAIASRCPLFIATDTCFTSDYPYLQSYTLSKETFFAWARRAVEAKGSGKPEEEEHVTRFVNLELQHPFGPDDRPGKFVPWVLGELLKNTPSMDMTSGEQKKDFVFVSDVVDACLCLLDKRDELSPGYTHLEVGRGEAVTIRDFVSTAHKLAGSTSQLNFGALPYRPNEIMHSEAKLEAMQTLGWSPKVSLEDGLQQTLDSIANERAIKTGGEG